MLMPLDLRQFERAKTMTMSRSVSSSAMPTLPRCLPGPSYPTEWSHEQALSDAGGPMSTVSHQLWVDLVMGSQGTREGVACARY